MMPRSSKLGSFCSSIVSRTAPAGTPTPLTSAIASCLVCCRVHSVTIASTSASRFTRAAPVAKRGSSISSSRPISRISRAQCSGLARLVVM